MPKQKTYKCNICDHPPYRMSCTLTTSYKSKPPTRCQANAFNIPNYKEIENPLKSLTDRSNILKKKLSEYKKISEKFCDWFELPPTKTDLLLSEYYYELCDILGRVPNA